MTEDDTFNALKKSPFNVICRELRHDIYINVDTYYPVVYWHSKRILDICQTHNWTIDEFNEALKTRYDK